MENLVSSDPVSTPLPTPTPDSVEPPLETQPKTVVRKSKRKLAQLNAAALPKPRPIPVIKKAPRDPNAPKRKRGRPRKYDVNMVQPATIMTTSKLGENPAQMQYMQHMQHMHMNAHLMGQQQQQNMIRQQHAMQVYQEQLRRQQQQRLFQQRQQQQQQYRNPSNFVSDYFDFTAQSLKVLDEHSGGSVHSLKSTGGTAPQHKPPVSSSGPVSVVAVGNPPAPAQPPLANPPNHLPHSGTSSSSFPSAVSTVGSYSTTDSATIPKENVPAALPAQPIIISKTEGIKYDTHVNSTTLPPPHILQKSIPPQHLAHANPSADPNTLDNTNPGLNNPAHSVAPPLESLYRPRIITVGGKQPDYIPQQNDLNPQEWLDRRFEERGYSIENFSSLECAYYNKPTEFQQASYGLKVVNMCRTNDVEGLKEVMECGLSYNPCNQFGESLIHMACRRGNYELLKYLMDRGCSVQICDDFGRTPLHDACWTSEPNFKIVELLLDTDVRLLHVVDCRGATPLAYIKRENWHKWKEFFHSKLEIYWFTRDSESLGEEPPPALSLEAPCSRVLVDHDSPLSVVKAAELASGKISPHELKEEQRTERS